MPPVAAFTTAGPPLPKAMMVLCTPSPEAPIYPGPRKPLADQTSQAYPILQKKVRFLARSMEASSPSRRSE